MDLAQEWFPVVDENGIEIGRALRHICHDGKSFLLHPVVHLHLLNSEGCLFLQKRSANKDVQPGKWDTSVGGHISPGESPEVAVLREASEELGLTNIKPVYLGRYIWNSDVERELVSSFLVTSEFFPTINKDEIEEGRFWSFREINDRIGKGVFTPNFEHEFTVVLSGKI